MRGVLSVFPHCVVGGKLERMSNVSFLTKYRRNSQVYVFYQMESPYFHNFSYRKFDGIFNATMTYRLDSTYPVPYSSIGLLKKSLKPTDKVQIQKSFKKKHGILAVISNCRSVYRNNLVTELLNHLNVTVFGRCSNQFTGKKNLVTTSLTELAKSFKFYLSFENSKCEDYSRFYIAWPVLKPVF